ncbi:MAG: 50S ribosomal protein L3 [Syntrophales bacterium]|jgi:large subunit ribosomal protein L3|nr:50S ribosomal protein L3 [Syntrophales bacterium]MDD4338639.1 50S ribosomal protein L3 [Syntrophales bacterium]HOG07869.1 50S ribosomal protein L3 [Syntrophales bacterium]HOS76757.1 50S ribosomal protein L3 [Syntrophales bacterium]HPB69714.1 50S ribosomal protein L3 [Syntrophales bacterium]
MKAGLIGRKLGMTQIFTEDGAAVPVTVIEMEPSVVIQKKTVKTDGYDALQLGYGRIKQKNVTKPLQGHLLKAGKGFFRHLREFRISPEGYEPGQDLTAETFAIGDYVDVVGISKGKGFAGVMKRHGFGGGRATHGSMFHRAPGSIGASAYPSRVFKGTRLPGQLGDVRKTVQNLMVMDVRPDRNVILVKGAVPGGKAGVLLVKKAIKK